MKIINFNLYHICVKLSSEEVYLTYSVVFQRCVTKVSYTVYVSVIKRHHGVSCGHFSVTFWLTSIVDDPTSLTYIKLL